LAGILKAVISMRLVRAAKGSGRVPAIEVMVSTGLIRDYIINEEKDLPDSRSDRERHFTVRDADLRPGAVSTIPGAENQFGKAVSQCHEPGRVQDARSEFSRLNKP